MAGKPKGRGELLEMLRKQTEKTVGIDQAAIEALPPKARGRAALLHKLQQQVGANPKLMQVAAAVDPIPGPSTRESPARISSRVPELTMQEERKTFKGESGTPLNATANYVRLEVEPDRGVYEYEVRFRPDLDARSNRVKLLNAALGEHSTTKVYDGDSCLYLPGQYLTGVNEFDNTLPSTGENVKTIITFKRKKKLHECIHLYNVLFKRIMHILLYTKMGRNYFDTEHSFLVPQHKLEIFPGYAVSVDEMEGGLMVCLDTQHRVIRTQTVYELLDDIRASNAHDFKEVATRSIIGSCVITKYNNKNYVVDDIGWNMTPMDSFQIRGGSLCTYSDYYKQQYNIKIQDVEQPLLISKQTKTVNQEKIDRLICLVPEFCNLTGLTDAMRSDFKVMKDVAAYTRVTPNQRMFALRTYLGNVKQSEEAQKVLAGWGLKLVDGTSNIPARVLPQEAVFFGGGQDRKFVGSDWNKAVTNNSIIGPMDINNWILLYTGRDERNAQNFVQTILRLAKGMGCFIKEPRLIMVKDDRTDSWMEAINTNIRPDTQVVVCICPTLRADRYTVIKKICCTQTPIASQVIIGKTLSNPKNVRTIIHKIAMQITCKLGGSLWSVSIPVKNWMICGIDVYHGTNKQSVCGFVSSITDQSTKYYSESVFQGGEIGDFFKMTFRKALLERKNRLGCFPTKIIMFRDGVGDGQLEHCRNYEVKQFQAVLEELNIDAGLVFVVVQKRISTRIFHLADSQTAENPPAGTVVDSMVTRRNYPDFYLVPQSVRQGTVNPTHYIVVHNDCDVKPDHLERLAYKLCHLYYNWSGTIRVPAPCLYAHKLAALVGQYLKKLPDSKLSDKLFYL